MKITLIGPVYPYRGGIAHFTSMLATKLLDDDNEIQLISFKKLYPSWLYPGKSDKDPSLEPLKVDAQFLLNPLDPLSWQKTVDAICNYRPEIVIVQWWVTFLAPMYTFIGARLRKKGFRFVYIIHNVMPHEARWWDKWLARIALKQASKYIVLTDKEKSRLEAFLPGREVLVSPHPIYDMFAKDMISKRDARENLGLDTKTPTVLFFGIIRPYKGLKYLLNAIGKLKAEGKRVQLIIAGECWEDPSIYQQQITGLGITDLVLFENRYIPNEEVNRYFSAADLFVAPYIGGTQSGVVKIALGFHLPIILSTQIAEAYLSENYANMIKLVNPLDIVQLSNSIEEMLSITLRSSDEEPNSDAVPQDFQWDKLVKTIQQTVFPSQSMAS